MCEQIIFKKRADSSSQPFTNSKSTTVSSKRLGVFI